MENKICKICGVHEAEGVAFHTHHVKFRSNGGSDRKENLIDICSDCHHDIHYPGKNDGEEVEELEEAYRDAISDDIFSGGWGILPKKIAHDPKISAFAKILYSDISSLCADRGYCWASNAYFAKTFNVSLRTVSRAILEIAPYLIIKNHLSAKRTIWVHQLNSSASAGRVYSKPATPAKQAKPKKEKKEVVPKYTDNDLRLAELLHSKILYNFPAFENKKVKINEWADDIRMLREIDKATEVQIEFMIMWLQGGEYTPPGKPTRTMSPHDFWSKNILSAGKLRKQWFTLVPQLQEELKKVQKKSTVTQL